MYDEGTETPETGGQKPRETSLIIERLLDPLSAKGYEVVDQRILQEKVLMLIGAGKDTTSNALILGLYHICKNLDIQLKLKAELVGAFPGAMSEITYSRARKLPYLV